MRAQIVKELPIETESNRPAASKISSLEAQNWKLTQLLEPKFLVDTITQAVASSLNISGGNKPQKSNPNGVSGYTTKPYLGKPRPPQLAPGVDGSLDPELSCWYCKDTDHLKENCVKLNRRLALENRQPDRLPKIWKTETSFGPRPTQRRDGEWSSSRQ